MRSLALPRYVAEEWNTEDMLETPISYERAEFEDEFHASEWEAFDEDNLCVRLGEYFPAALWDKMKKGGRGNMGHATSAA